MGIQVCLGCSLKRGSDEESIGKDQDEDNRRRKQQEDPENAGNAGKRHSVPRGYHSSAEHQQLQYYGSDKKVQPETKSDIL